MMAYDKYSAKKFLIKKCIISKLNYCMFFF